MTTIALPPAFAVKAMASTCTVWVGATNTRGYALISVNGRVELAHRVAYAAVHGPIAEGMVIDHLCRVRNCVKVEHLEAVTTAENVRRGRLAARLSVGDECPNGHLIADATGIYTRPNGLTECRSCRAAAPHRSSKARPTRQRRAARVRGQVNAADMGGAR